MARARGTSILLAEIAEQPEALARFLSRERKRVTRLARALAVRKPRFVLIAARGTSDNAARYAQYAFGLTNRLPVALAAPSLTTLYRRTPRLQGALVIGISQSGRSPDIFETLAAARRSGVPTLAIVNDPESPLAKAADAVIPLHAGVERSVAATKTYTAQLAAVALLAEALAGNEKGIDALERIPASVERALGGEAAAERAAPVFARSTRAVVVARGVNYPTAHEIALKLKELALLLAEPYSSADFQHGPIAMAEPGLPVLLVSPPGTRPLAELLALAASLRKKGSEVVELGPRSRGAIPVPRVSELLSPIVAVVPGQLLAFHTAMARGLDPETPRGLRKITETR